MKPSFDDEEDAVAVAADCCASMRAWPSDPLTRGTEDDMGGTKLSDMNGKPPPPPPLLVDGVVEEEEEVECELSGTKC